MSLSSRESSLAQLREALAQLNSELFLTIIERRSLCIKIQEFKETGGRFSSYDPTREKEVFTLHVDEIKKLTLKELLAFSLLMEDQAQAYAPGSYPSWSQCTHLIHSQKELIEMINPLLLKFRSLELFSKLNLSSEFIFLRDL
jgi:chorismate mutase